jgi:serine/threonine-protein kinase RIM15
VPFVRRHVTRRRPPSRSATKLRVTNTITSFFDEKLQEGELELELRDRERDRDQQSPGPEFIRDAFVLQQGAAPKSASVFLLDDASSDGGYGAEPLGNHSRQRASLDANAPTLAAYPL